MRRALIAVIAAGAKRPKPVPCANLDAMLPGTLMSVACSVTKPIKVKPNPNAATLSAPQRLMAQPEISADGITGTDHALKTMPMLLLGIPARSKMTDKSESCAVTRKLRKVARHHRTYSVRAC